MAESWQTSGTVLIACNCDYGCPCNFNANPTQGHCEGSWTWHIESGRYGDVALDGLSLTVAADWPKAIHEGGGEAVGFVDERADDRQREALTTLLRGDAGGPWGVFINTYRLDGPHAARYEIELNGKQSRLRVGDAIELEMEAIRNPVTGAEFEGGAVLGTGLVFKEGSFAASKVFRVQDGVSYDHSGKYAAWGPFEYAGPPAG